MQRDPLQENRTDVVIIGAGISGLCTAHWLNKRDIKTLVLEQDAEVGGTMRSVRENGYLIETGPNSALETTPLIKELVSDCGLEKEFVYAHPVGKNRYILRDGALHALPLSPPAFVASSLFSISGKLRILKEPFVGRAKDEESIAQFVSRRVGREFLDYAIDPFVAGIFAGRPEALSVRSAFPKLYALEEKYGGLVKGMIKGRRERMARNEKAKDRAESFSFRSGMQTLPLALARGLGDRVVVSAKVHSFQKDESSTRYLVAYSAGGNERRIETSSVVLAIPAYAAAGYIRSFSPNVAGVLDSISYSPVVSIFLGFRREDVRRSLDGFGFLIPTKEHRNILGCLWSSSLFPDRAPEGDVAFTAFVGGARQPTLTDLSENELRDLVLSELKNIMQIGGKHVYFKPTRWSRAIPQYEIGYEHILASLNRFEAEHPGILLCSNYRGGISVGDCVRSGREAAERIELLLRRLTTS